MKNVKILALVACAPLLLAVESANIGPAKDLHRFVGKWKGSGTMTERGESHAIQAKYKCRKAAGGFAVACEFKIKGVPGMAEYTSADIWGYDANDASVHWYVVTNGGETHDHKGKLTAEGFRGRYESTTKEGRPLIEDIAFTFEGPDLLRASSDLKINGLTTESISLILKR